MGLLTDADAEIRAWLERAAGDAPVEIGPPGTSEDTDGDGARLAMYLLALEPVPKVANDRHFPVPVVIRLRYLVAPSAPDHPSRLELLDRVLAAVHDDPPPHHLDAEFTPAPTEVWSDFDARPRPALSLQVTARGVRAPVETGLVRQPLRVVEAGIRGLRGRVLGPEDIPLAGAEVAVAATGASTRTASNGSFLLPTVPDAPEPIRLSVRAKGRTFSVDVEPADVESLVIRCDLLEA